ncbi:anaerobic selenocysteine-containing dehydrogenase [Desulfosalsimonas propionicica]|uniref:Anaerobic selenocysteine-containing dehydrogenase n=1 Tax=Desulfosalsimonas propionicica TaxID=332175 RepID=A0A7W0CAA8_9BACT|nr:molybdopterin-dependent oxidoreductase [Desulfosalsimonas propionicica]MBA2881964.1 anaerobic selenocysteine-containing dehydrogenase [Desulfosalsimonas propionicica]
MKIDRRCFLSLVIGGAVGTTLTPVPWKLTDDIAIWSQNWPWTPVPEDGPSKFVKSVCTQCPGGCGITVRTIGDRAIKIEGQPDHPVNNGSLCPRAISATQHLYGPSRIQGPMKRAGERGQGKWEKISWDEAIKTVTEKLAELRTRGKPHTVACISDTDGNGSSYLMDRFLQAYGSPNFIRTPSSADAQELALYLSCGRQGTIGYDFRKADFILSFGCALMDGCDTAGQVMSAFGEQDKKTRLVQIEARLSDTAAKAAQWVPAKPGSETALALGLGHVIVRDGLYNKAFIDNHGFAFEDWQDDAGNTHPGYRSLVQDHSPDKVAKATGLSEKVIESLARSFARAHRPVAVSGLGSAAPDSLDQALAVFALNALAGNFQKPGGVFLIDEPDYLSWTEMKIDKTASAGNQHPRVDGAGSEKFAHTRYLPNRLPEAINSAKGDSPVQALLVAGGNPLYTLADPRAAQKAFEKIPFIVSFSTFIDETAEQADLLLPHPHFLESYQDVPTPRGMAHTVVSLARPVVKPQYDTRHMADVVIQIAKNLGGFIENAFPWKNYEDFLRKSLSDQWKTLEKKGFWSDSRSRDTSLDKIFRTSSQRFEFFPMSKFAAMNGNGNKKAGVEKIELPGNIDKLPLVLVPYTSMRISDGAVANTPFMTKTLDANVVLENDVFVEINPKTASEYGLSQGDKATVKTQAGRAEVRVNLFEGIMPGLVAMPAGLGRTGFSDYIAGKGANVYSLIAPAADPASGLNAAWGARAAIAKA